MQRLVALLILFLPAAAQITFGPAQRLSDAIIEPIKVKPFDLDSDR